MPQTNRIYIASKFGQMEGEVARLKAELEQRGFVVIYDWTENPVPKPFSLHLEQAQKAAEAMALAVMQCDIIIVLWAEGGKGFYVEMGGALVTSLVLTYMTGQKHKKIFLVGEDGYEQSIFFFHPQVTRVPTWQALLDQLSPV
jgi:hypothetical protein